jgi:hypothetical protein
MESELLSDLFLSGYHVVRDEASSFLEVGGKDVVK